MEHIEPVVTRQLSEAAKRPRRVTIAISINRELSRQIDQFAHEQLSTRSRLIERMLIDWIETRSRIWQTIEMMEAE